MLYSSREAIYEAYLPHTVDRDENSTERGPPEISEKVDTALMSFKI